MARVTAIEQAQTLLLEAAFDPGRWNEALTAMAAACGAVSGQLISLDGAGAVAAHWLTGVPGDFARRVEEFGLSDMRVNPRLRIGALAPVLQPVADQDHVDAETRARHPIYAEMFEPYDLAFNCQTVLVREPSRLVRMSVSRPARRGPFEAEDLRAFSALAPYVQAAGRFHLAADAAWTRSTLDILDALATPAFLLDVSGRVVALSREGECLARAGDIVRLVGGQLRAAEPADDAVLSSRIAAALAALQGDTLVARSPVRLRGRGDTDLAFEVQPLSRPCIDLGGAPVVVVAASKKIPTDADLGETLRRHHGLSAAEAEVALRITAGQSISSIADDRAVSRATVRSQVQAIYAKLKVRRQAELVARVRSLG